LLTAVLLDLAELSLQLLADVTAYQQGNERTDRRAVEPGGDHLKAFVNGNRLKVSVELLVDTVRYLVQLGVDFRLNGARGNRRKLSIYYGAIAKFDCARSDR
jgi:hypothetical protein